MNTGGSIEVYSAREVASASGVPVERVAALMATGELPSLDGKFVRHHDAVLWGRKLRGAHGLAVTSVPLAAEGAGATEPAPPMFEMRSAAERQPVVPAAVSVAAHLLVGAVAIFMTTLGLDSATPMADTRVSEPLRLVYLALPGPGGGGGGGGLRNPVPPPVAKRQGIRKLSSPVPERKPPPPVEPPKIETPPVPAHEIPAIVAPVVTSAADIQDKAGVLEKTEAATESQGSGTAGGVGSGQGSGIGEGDGSGIGPGSGGGTGGGPYRPGSGIQPPSLLREVKPTYTDEGRRQNITGDVVLEIVVRSDGRVGDVKVLDGLGHGLDQRAVEAVRQWRFSPARRMGQPVDVLVEVAVEFRLR